MKKIEEKNYLNNFRNIEFEYPYISKDEKCDVLIIGGGIAGAITAYEFAKENMNVIVVEKNLIGFANTSNNYGILDHELNRKNIKLYNKEVLSDLFKLNIKAIEEIINIDNEVSSESTIENLDGMCFTNNFFNKTEFSKQIEYINELGIYNEELEKQDFFKYKLGFLQKDALFKINTYKFTNNIFKYLNSMNNVKIFENTKATYINNTKNGKVIVTTQNDFKIECKKVIFTSSTGTIKYIKNAPIAMYKNFQIVTKPIFDNAENLNFIAKCFDTGRFINFDMDGRVILTGEKVRYVDKFENPKYENYFKKDKYKKMKNYVENLFNLKESECIDYMYSYDYIYTNDDLPIIDEIPDFKNCYCNLGFCNNSIIFNTVGALMLKNAIKGLYSKEMSLFKIQR